MANYYKFTLVDSITSIPVTLEKSPNGPILPADFVSFFMLESEYPTLTPTGYGSSEEDLSSVPGILSKVTAKEFKEAKKAEDEAFLEKSKEEFKAGINAIRNNKLYKPLYFLDHPFDVDLDSLNLIASAASLAMTRILNNDDTEFLWTTADNAKVPLTPVQMIELHAAFFARAQDNHLSASVAKHQVVQCKKLAELKNVSLDLPIEGSEG